MALLLLLSHCRHPDRGVGVISRLSPAPVLEMLIHPRRDTSRSPRGASSRIVDSGCAQGYRSGSAAEQDRRRRLFGALLSYGLALLLGIGFVALTLSLPVVLGIGVDDRFFFGDMAQHVVGQRYFIADAWRWPLLVAKGLGAPEGVNIALTDSIPIAAIVAKLLRSVLPTHSSTIFPWLGFAFVLQPIAAVFALRSAGEKRVLPAVAISVLALSMPTLLNRIGHTALCSHFLILIAIGLYFCIVRAEAVSWAAIVVLVPLTLLVHPYLVIMVAAVLAAAPVTLLLRGSRQWRRSTAALVLSLGATAIIAALLQYGGRSPGGGFGAASMNLLAPVYPRYSSLYAWLTGRAAPLMDPTGAQYFEGYQYLGAGLLLLIATAGVTLGGRGLISAVRRHAGAWIICTGLALLACSTTIYAGDFLLIQIAPVPAILHQLRASGRFFWPVTYFLAVAVVYTVARLRSAAVAGALLVAAAGVQYADTAMLRQHLVATVTPPPQSPEDHVLQEVIAAHRTLNLWPTAGCGQDPASPLFMRPILFASDTARPVNSMYLARYPEHELSCDSGAMTGALHSGELRLFLPGAQSVALMIPGARQACRRLGPYLACADHPALLADLPRLAAPTFPLGQQIEMTAPRLPPFASGGWYAPESPGTWTRGSDAVLAGQFARQPQVPLKMTVWASGLDDEKAKTVTVQIDTAVVATWAVRPGPFAAYDVVIPPALLAEGLHVIRFTIAHPARPADYKGIPDTRELGMFVSAVRFDSTAAASD